MLNDLSMVIKCIYYTSAKREACHYASIDIRWVRYAPRKVYVSVNSFFLSKTDITNVLRRNDI